MPTIKNIEMIDPVSMAKKIGRMKRKAKLIQLRLGISHAEALDQLAINNGFPNWSRLMLFANPKENIIANPGSTTSRHELSVKSSVRLSAKEFFSNCQDDRTLVQDFIDLGGSIHELDEDNENQVIRSSRYGHSNVLQELLKRGVSADQKTRDGYTALGMAAQNGHSDCCKILIEFDVDVNETNQVSSSPLNNAAWAGYYKTCEMLLDSGALMVYSKREGERANVLCTAAMRGRVSLFPLFIERGVDINAAQMSAGFNLWTPLMWAVYHGNIIGVKALIDLRADVNIICEKTGETALMQAAGDGKFEIFKLLLASGANKDVLDRKGESAYDKANPKMPRRSSSFAIPWSPDEDQDNGRVNIQHIYSACHSDSELAERVRLAAGTNQ